MNMDSDDDSARIADRELDSVVETSARRLYDSMVRIIFGVKL